MKTQFTIAVAAFAIALMSCADPPKPLTDQRSECYAASMQLLAQHDWGGHARLLCRKEFPSDSVLLLHEFCRLVGMREYPDAEIQMNKLVVRRSFPCIDSLSRDWHWEIKQLRLDPSKSPDASLDYLLQYLRNYSNSPC